MGLLWNATHPLRCQTLTTGKGLQVSLWLGALIKPPPHVQTGLNRCQEKSVRLCTSLYEVRSPAVVSWCDVCVRVQLIVKSVNHHRTGQCRCLCTMMYRLWLLETVFVLVLWMIQCEWMRKWNKNIYIRIYMYICLYVCVSKRDWYKVWLCVHAAAFTQCQT